MVLFKIGLDKNPARGLETDGIWLEVDEQLPQPFTFLKFTSNQMSSGRDLNLKQLPNERRHGKMVRLELLLEAVACGDITGAEHDCLHWRT